MERTTTATAEPRAFVARVDLEAEIQSLRQSPRPRGHVAKTLLHGPDLRIVLMALDEGCIIPDHHANGSLTLHVVDGRAVVNLLGASFDLVGGQVLAIERGITHSVVAIEDSAVLLTVAWARGAPH